MIALLIVAGLVYVLVPRRPSDTVPDTSAPAAASAPAGEYTTPPDEEGVAVDLPETSPDAVTAQPEN